jgi:hypothetical protein
MERRFAMFNKRINRVGVVTIVVLSVFALSLSALNFPMTMADPPEAYAGIPHMSTTTGCTSANCHGKDIKKMHVDYTYIIDGQEVTLENCYICHEKKGPDWPLRDRVYEMGYVDDPDTAFNFDCHVCHKGPHKNRDK